MVLIVQLQVLKLLQQSPLLSRIRSVAILGYIYLLFLGGGGIFTCSSIFTK